MRHKCGPTATFQSLLLGMQNTQDHSLTKWIQHLCVLQNNPHPSVWVIIAQIWGILRCSLTSKWMVHPHKGLWFCMKRNNLCGHKENPQRTSVLYCQVRRANSKEAVTHIWDVLKVTETMRLPQQLGEEEIGNRGLWPVKLYCMIHLPKLTDSHDIESEP